MTDLEITKLCAEAMGLTRATWFHWPDKFVTHCDDEGVDQVFNPLHDDAQAMALVKKFGLWMETDSSGHWWQTCPTKPTGYSSGDKIDLNRAICECVAKMQLNRQFGQPHYGHDR